MHDEDPTARIADSLYKIGEEFPAVELVDPDTALDGDGNGNCVLHGLEAVRHEVLILHEACPEIPVLHAVRRASAVQVHFLETRGFHELACLREVGRVAAPELQNCGVLEGLVPEKLFWLCVEHRVRDDHLAVEQNVLGNQPQKVALVTVGAVEHRRDGKSAVEVQVHARKCRKITGRVPVFNPFYSRARDTPVSACALACQPCVGRDRHQFLP